MGRPSEHQVVVSHLGWCQKVGEIRRTCPNLRRQIWMAMSEPRLTGAIWEGVCFLGP